MQGTLGKWGHHRHDNTGDMDWGTAGTWAWRRQAHGTLRGIKTLQRAKGQAQWGHGAARGIRTAESRVRGPWGHVGVHTRPQGEVGAGGGGGLAQPLKVAQVLEDEDEGGPAEDDAAEGAALQQP